MRKFFTLAAFVLFCLYGVAALVAPEDRTELAVVPLIAAAGFALLAASGRWWPLVLVPVAAATIACSVWSPSWLVYLPPSLINFMVAGIFFGSLRPGRDPVISRIARIAHGGVLEPQFVGYTRTVTVFWGFLLAGCGVLAGIVAAVAPRAWWWTFANVIVYVLFFLAFVVEYAIRVRRFPGFDHVSPLRLIGVVRRHGVASARRVE